MKKILSFSLIVFATTVLTVGFLVFDRFRKNKELYFPYPYEFKDQSTAISIEAPILVIGDRMGEYLARFKVEMASVISKNLSKPIQIESMAQSGIALHRTLRDLESLVRWPQIVIFHGASEEMKEEKFLKSQIPLIKENFNRYSDARLSSLMLLLPWTSRLIYEPIQRVHLPSIPQLREEMEESDYLTRLDTEILIFEQQLIRLVDLSKDRNSLLILTTTPINLETEPKKTCHFTTTVDIQMEQKEISNLLQANDLKSAYSRSRKLVELNSGNALLYFQHAKIAKMLGIMEEAKEYFIKAAAFDCIPWRSTEVHNSLIRKVAKSRQVLLFDFAKFMQEKWGDHETFFDELHPENVYYEKASEQLGIVIREILKL